MERAVAVVHQQGNGIVTGVGGDNVELAIAVEITGCEALHIQPRGSHKFEVGLNAASENSRGVGENDQWGRHQIWNVIAVEVKGNHRRARGGKNVDAVAMVKGSIPMTTINGDAGFTATAKGKELDGEIGLAILIEIRCYQWPDRA